MKKILFNICFILLFGALFTPFLAQSVYASERPNQVKVVLQTYVYTDASITSPIFQVSGKDYKLDTNTVLNVDISFNDDTFYKVNLFDIIPEKTADDYGYVLIAHTMDANDMSPTKKLDTNAKIKNDNAIVYKKDTEGNYVPTEIRLQKDTAVRILDGYDKKREYTYISFYDNDNNIISYYIKTADLSVSGVNYSLIIGIISLISCISVILIVFGIKGRKKKNKIQK